MSEVELENPPELLDHLIDELIDFKEQRGEDLEVEWVPEEGVFRVVQGAPVEVDIFTAEIDVDFYGDSDAVVVEAEVGPLEEVADLAELLKFSDAEQVYSRLAVGEREDGDVLLVQAALPASHLTPAQLDGMLREVGSIAVELGEEEPSETA